MSVRQSLTIRLWAALSLSLAVLTGCGTPPPESASVGSQADNQVVRELDWLELMPPDELEALQSAPPVVHDGNFKALQSGSAKTVPGMDGQRVRIPGYIVPIESDGAGDLVEFFLVPYFGACIHVPPPPPNQIIYGKNTPAIPMTDIYAAYWVEGVLRARAFEDETAATAYSMEVSRVYLWE